MSVVTGSGSEKIPISLHSKANVCNSSSVSSEWNDACSTKLFLFNIYKVIEQTEDNVTCRFLKIVDQIEHSFERCYEKDAHKRCLTVELLSEEKIDNLSFGNVFVMNMM